MSAPEHAGSAIVLTRPLAVQQEKQWVIDAIVADSAASSKPASPQSKPLAFLRYKVLNTYQRLFSLALLSNVAAFVTRISLAAGIARQPLVVNLLFRTLCLVPHSAPLRLRHLACKIFHLGGVHSGCGVGAYAWYAGFLVYYTKGFVPAPTATAVLVIAYAVLVLLTFIVVVAYPKFRIVRHDWFELTHRFSSWATMAIVWALVLAVASGESPSMGGFLVTSPAFWMLVASTAAIIHPWLLLRRVEVVPEPLSTHAVRLHFSHTSVVFGQGMSVSKHPLRDWHSFAAFTDKCDTPDTQFSLLRGVPIYGFGYVMKVFPRIVLVTTGSGIGPCLSFIEDEKRPAMRITYGPRVIELVKKMDPNPEIIDTSKGGRRDLLPIAIRLYREFNAEAVGIISNGKVTRSLVYNLERRGIPAYGPIFDS
ncbi:hypothetical protein PG994_009729 [Apiospora phragmitis]|uniref:Integral membrane protein TmpA n=1 Tax=Apiospora phragmitis TaxID=2905665 RepID=A0ABR1U716_9PEZI